MLQLFRTTALTGAILAALAGCSSDDSSPVASSGIYLYKVTSDGMRIDAEMTAEERGYVARVKLGKGEQQFRISDGSFMCGSDYGAADAEAVKLGVPVSARNCNAHYNFRVKLTESGEYEFRLERNVSELYDLTISPTDQQQAAAGAVAGATGTAIAGSCPTYQGGPVTANVAPTFRDGELVKDYYSGQTATVQGGKVTMTPAAESGGLLLLESAGHKPTAFSWDNATVYFVMTDRFNNGNPANDNSYGRSKDGKDEIGTFHGGDIKGLTEKLDYLEELGINAIWITAPYEQLHGWVGGGIRGDFKHYAYHGYYVLDFTKIDQNVGTEAEFKAFVDAAHKRGIRVVMDVVMNHTGYATLADMQEFKFGATQDFDKPIEEILGVTNWTEWQPGAGENWHSFNNFIDYGNAVWADTWWGRDWIRTDIAGYKKPGRNDLTMMLAYLPDFMTESKAYVDLPPFLKNKPDTNAKYMANATVRDYLVTWLTDWVRTYGVDGFRLDTAKHVEMESIAALKAAGEKALAEWKAKNPQLKIDDAPFWMTAEVWGHDVSKSPYFSKGNLDSIINFTYQVKDGPKALQCVTNAEATFSDYATKVNSDPDFNVLSYISSHDTSLFMDRSAKNDLTKQKQIAAPFLMLPGGVQIFYGDETGREMGPFGSDKMQGTRSYMNWDDLNKPEYAALVAHWQKLGQFRNRHTAIGGGQHSLISEAPYTFSRVNGDDRVVVVMAGNGG